MLLQGGTEELKLGMPLADALLGPRVTIAGKLDRGADGALSASDIDIAGSGIILTGEAAADAASGPADGRVQDRAAAAGRSWPGARYARFRAGWP